MKDLSKAFLTLLTAVFVASLTFSDRIVNFGATQRGPQFAMIFCWILLLVAIAAVGAALALMTWALGFAAYLPESDYPALEARAVPFFLGAGIAFGAAMTSMLVAGVLTVLRPARTVQPEPDGTT